MRITLLDTTKSVTLFGEVLSSTNPTITVDKVALLNTARLHGADLSSDLTDLKIHFQHGLIQVVDGTMNVGTYDDLVRILSDGVLEAPVSVADVTALKALAANSLLDGSLVYVQSLKAHWVLQKASALAADDITIATATGGGRWHRVSAPATAWQTQATWYISAGTGNDENAGSGTGTAIKTFAEWRRRVGSEPKVSMDLTIVTLGATDFLDFDLRLADGLTFTVQGVTTQADTGTLTAVTAKDPSLNQPWVITDATQDWAPHVGKLIHFTASDSWGWIVKDLGANQARVSQPILVGATHFEQCTAYTIVGNEAYEILDVPTVNVGAGYSIAHELKFNNPQVVTFKKLNIQGKSNSIASSTGRIRYTRCYAANMYFYGNSSFEGVFFDSSTVDSNLNNTVYIGGCAIKTYLLTSGAISFARVGSIGQAGFISANFPGYLSISTDVGVFDSSSSAFSVSAVKIMATSAGSRLYGSGNGAYGVVLQDGARMQCNDFLTKCFVTGTSGNFKLGATAIANHMPNILASAGAVLPAAAPCTTWAQVAAAPFSGSVTNYNTLEVMSA